MNNATAIAYVRDISYGIIYLAYQIRTNPAMEFYRWFRRSFFVCLEKAFVRSFRIVNREIGRASKNNWKRNPSRLTQYSVVFVIQTPTLQIFYHSYMNGLILLVWSLSLSISFFKFISHPNYSLLFINSISLFWLLLFSRISIFFFFFNFRISLLSSVCLAIVHVVSEDYTNFRIQLRKHRNELLDPAAFNRL